MPTYRFYNKNTKTEFEEYMSIADMEKFTKKKHITLMPPTQMNIVSSVGQIDSKTDSGWKDHLSRIAEKHPESNLGKRYRRQGVKESRTRAVLNKHRKRAKNKQNQIDNSTLVGISYTGKQNPKRKLSYHSLKR